MDVKHEDLVVPEAAQLRPMGKQPQHLRVDSTSLLRTAGNRES